MYVHHNDIVELADWAVDLVKPAVTADWTVPAGSLEWDVEGTVVHMATSLAKYTLYLASRSTRYIAISCGPFPGATRDDLLDAIVKSAQALTTVAASAPEGTRAFHTAGMADPEGYVALGCFHLLEHGYDVALGLRIPFDPPAGLCQAVMRRLTPWAPVETPPWPTFLWQAGRADLPGKRPVESDLIPHVGPLSEWDGTIPRAAPFPVAAYVRDPDSRRWRPMAD